MGVSYFERNGIFASNCTWSSFSFNGVLIPRRPIFPIGLTVKKVHVFGVKVQNYGAINALLKGESDNDNRLVGGGILEKELQFKPSFNEYLKAMESVRVRRLLFLKLWLLHWKVFREISFGGLGVSNILWWLKKRCVYPLRWVVWG